ncbi:hypothetical protein B0T26DRAFT_64377 [Lasiosphaeria miniovina]|uniref:Zn(2)-C6 fungal-type domain-containing protein n=1 Tax=Lasiosphaeria miniovina TaxID=1954250 RepID=A0AA40BHG5_9PEZI|nr:uncharacterized protein B0T26DRAFT_64377 [Lasiosphaeria miniovina]KAK0734308.1 hypothetical protein B0T26DRAFT_64377 [Lasiosphaeria miniovina]
MSAASSSPATSPQAASAGAKSSRVCLNCRRKKKRCDKALPSCGRCTYSLQACQHEDDVVLPLGSSSAQGPIRFEPFLGHHVSPTLTFASSAGDPVLEHFASQQLATRWNALNQALFAPMDSAEDIHSFAFRCLSEIVGGQRQVDYVASHYFLGVNTWFTVVERESFNRQLEDLWTTPSAETCALILSMRLITRVPDQNNPGGMGDSLYLSVKTTLSVIQTKIPLSIPLLQAELLVAMYEFSHSMSQQAYMTAGRCFQMSKAFNWHYKPFWSEERQRLNPRDLKLFSILWWAIVYVDCLIHVGYQDQKYPMHTSGLSSDFWIPFPEAFDQYLLGSLMIGFQGGPIDANIDQIDTMVWPEASSAWYMSNVLHQLTAPSPVSPVDRNTLSGVITQHTLQVMERNWKMGDRTGSVGTNFIALMKLNQPGLLAGFPTDNAQPIETIRSVIKSVYSTALNNAASTSRLSNGGVSPCGAFALYYASLLLISHGEGVLEDAGWLQKVEVLKKSLEWFSARWKLADKYLESLNIALTARLAATH